MLGKTTGFEMSLSERMKAGQRLCWPVVLLLLVCAGCASHAQSKEAAMLRWQKASAQMKFAMAQQQYDNAKYELATQTVQQALSADPNMPEARLLMGKLLLTGGSTRKAAEELRRAVELNEKLHEGWYWLGVVAQEDKDYQTAYEHYDRAMSAEPTNVDYILAVAETHVASNNYAEAGDLLSQKAAALPHDISLKVAAADVMLRLGKSEQAIEFYRESLLLAGDNVDISESLAYCYLFSEQWNKAAEIFNTLIDKCSDEQKRKAYLKVTAMCSMNGGRYEQAADSYSKLSLDERDSAELWVSMGRAALGAGVIPRATMCAEKAMLLHPGYAEAMVLLGCAQYADGDYDRAVGTFEKLTMDKDNRGFSWLMMARCYEQMGRKERAEEAYNKALEADPDSELGKFLAGRKDI